MKKWMISALLFSVAVNISVLGTLIYFWSKTNNTDHTLTWHSIDTNDANDILIVKQLNTVDSCKIMHFKDNWTSQIGDIRQQISSDRDHIIKLMLKQPPDRDSIDIVIDSLVVKQVRAEKYTIDHLLDLRKVLPADRWELMVRSLNQPQKIIIQKKILNKDGSPDTLLELEDIEIEAKVKINK